jgi:hypothetical protein
MRRGVGAVAAVLLLAAPLAAHEMAPLDARRPTPGLLLDLVEVPPGPGEFVPGYRLLVWGFRRGIVYNVWARDFGHSFREIASGFRLGRGTAPVASEFEGGGPRRLDEVVFSPGPYPRGAAWEVAIASDDLTLAAFARVIPRPIIARDGTCTVSLELASRRADRFVASGSGFAPGEGVTTQLTYAGQDVRKRQLVSADGRLLPEALSYAVHGPDPRARYVVAGRTCKVTIDYQWGEAGLARN